ncbi:hypothetical protein M885DRAFT_127580 [Pelagophyceae sp. CCMP2097]|nr:hypothetical protein M885DRAFT_127580 [Pelagophyceae sp. CCMP2097]
MGLLRLALCASAVSAGVTPLVTFDGADGTTFHFVALLDPVMGGQSTGEWNDAGGAGRMNGTVVNVPSLNAPGFIKVAADGKFRDASSATDQGAIVLTLKSATPAYKGFRVTLVSGAASPSYACAGGGELPLSRGCFKADFRAPADLAKVVIPLGAFSDKWSPATGDATATCAQDASACLTAAKLGKVQRVELWAEGASGDVDLIVTAISAASPAAVAAIAAASNAAAAAISARAAPPPPGSHDTCGGVGVQPELRFGVSGRDTAAGVPAAPQNETLAYAVCCDDRTMLGAEPRFLYEAPDIALFDKLDEKQTTFYDSVCGLPLFVAPQNRTLADFELDTRQHGWPSFRAEEVVLQNVVTDMKTGLVTSKCGTHLGTFLPDANGDRWCIDLVCVAGKPVAGKPVAGKPVAGAP